MFDICECFILFLVAISRLPAKFTTLHNWDGSMPLFISDFSNVSEIHPLFQLTVPSDMHFFCLDLAKKTRNSCDPLSVSCFVLHVSLFSGQILFFFLFGEKVFMIPISESFNNPLFLYTYKKSLNANLKKNNREHVHQSIPLFNSKLCVCWCVISE